MYYTSVTYASRDTRVDGEGLIRAPKTTLFSISIGRATAGIRVRKGFWEEEKAGCRWTRGVLDDIIRRLLETKGGRAVKNAQVTDAEIRQLCVESKEVFVSQPILLELEAPIKICGDIHGQYTDLLRLFEYGGYPPQANYLFLGDYVDRGKQSIETICLLLAYKIKYPENFFLLRGNHECASINRIYGFYDECKRRYNVRLWKVFTDCFNCLPVAALVDDKILCMHGGLSPELKSLDQIRNLARPVDIPDQGLLCDLLWSDPDKDIEGWGENDRGVSYTFGPDKVAEFLQKHDLDLICRAHQVVEDGYEFFAKRQLILKPADKKKGFGNMLKPGTPPRKVDSSDHPLGLIWNSCFCSDLIWWVPSAFCLLKAGLICHVTFLTQN
ncbi:hypothetical protein OPV22_004299 [Ensete ventricosum]|uniref:Serine/threonine-protein phosphatase n=1 Tax=Ensete ventricosum TaxID=4639 RepID=A0AAV8S3C4_ENSVE|nr:hypothetical protein OPV22_004299 [Ensete ventricosum]